MKTNPLILAGTAACLLLLGIAAMLFSRQAALDAELAATRSALAEMIRSTAAPTFARETPAAEHHAASRIGIPRALDTDELLEAARQRIAELERVLHGQADVLEQLVAEQQRREEERRKAAMRPWGPEQASGPPDTMTAGDHRTAWAPAVADGGIEWIEAQFENAADLARIVVRQTCNPGCITKVTAIADDGAEVPVWAGTDPSAGQPLADTPFNVPPGINARRVKVYLDTKKMPGWEEIDAIQMIGRDGSAQWAKSTNASSTYATAGRTRLDGLEYEGGLLLLQQR